MFGKAELAGLSQRKAALGLRIAQRRGEMVADAGSVASLLRQIDPWLVRLHRVSRFWPVLLTFARLRRGRSPLSSKLGLLFRWAPLVVKIVRAVKKNRGLQQRPFTYAGRGE
jgi:hypothetical protein